MNNNRHKEVRLMCQLPMIISSCSHLQGKHCTKIGSKCIEKRWFNNDECLLAVKTAYRGAPPPVDSRRKGGAIAPSVSYRVSENGPTTSKFKW